MKWTIKPIEILKGVNLFQFLLTLSIIAYLIMTCTPSEIELGVMFYILIMFSSSYFGCIVGDK